MRQAAMTMSPAKASSSTSGSTALFSWEPRREPPMPTAPNTRPLRTRTRPARQWATMPTSAVSPTTRSDVVVAALAPWPAP